MKTINARVVICVLLVLCAAAGLTVYAAFNYGSKDDPLVTKSYLDEVLMPELVEEFNARLDALDSAPAGSGAFSVLTLSRGQTVSCQVGCEIMLRIGTAVASGADSPALVDTTSGSTLDAGGALEKNHLYMATIVNNGLTAAGDSTKILIRGEYTVS